MANKALNQVSQVQSTELANVKTFLAVMNNGEIKQMSKEDMSAVVEGLIGGFKYEGEVGSRGIKDFDEVKKTGFYIVSIWNDTVSNKPNINYGIMIVLNTKTYMLQVVFDLFSSTINFRTGDGSYGSWNVK